MAFFDPFSLLLCCCWRYFCHCGGTARCVTVAEDAHLFEGYNSVAVGVEVLESGILVLGDLRVSLHVIFDVCALQVEKHQLHRLTRTRGELGSRDDIVVIEVGSLELVVVSLQCFGFAFVERLLQLLDAIF